MTRRFAILVACATLSSSGRALADGPPRCTLPTQAELSFTWAGAEAHLWIDGNHVRFTLEDASEHAVLNAELGVAKCHGRDLHLEGPNSLTTSERHPDGVPGTFVMDFVLDESFRAEEVRWGGGPIEALQIISWSGQRQMRNDLFQGTAQDAIDAERAEQREREERDRAQKEKNKAHVKELRDSFKRPTKPALQENRRDKEACLRSDVLACERLKPPPSPDRTEECHQRQTIAFQTCHSKSSTCRRKCENDRFQCWKSACDAACAKNPNGLQCNLLCACPKEITCDCDFCQGVGTMCGPTPSGATPVK